MHHRKNKSGLVPGKYSCFFKGPHKICKTMFSRSGFCDIVFCDDLPGQGFSEIVYGHEIHD